VSTVRALLVANSIDADPGFVGERLRHHGFAFDECLRESPGEWPDLVGHDLVLLLGSEWSVYWDRVRPNVEAESALIREATRTGVPIFGICFGSQMIAHTLGGSVHRATRPEVGWHRVESEVPEVIAPGPWLQWHFDVFTPPPGWEVMATSPSGPQAIRSGRTFATQFHPEANESMLAAWTAGSDGTGSGDLARLGMSADEVMAQTRDHVKTSRPDCARIVDWFMNHVAHG
jgi:GMP synthase-like glutamine amidotransferase